MNIDKISKPKTIQEIHQEIMDGLNEYQLTSSRHMEAIIDREGIDFNEKPTTLGQHIGRLLHNECIPNGDFTDINEFYKAMLDKVKQYNSNLPSDLSWQAISPWKYDESKGELFHRTGSGRMSIILRNNLFNVNLFSPDYADGDRPFYSITLQDGKLYSTLIEPTIIDKHNRWDRLLYINDYLIEIFGTKPLLEASDQLTRSYIIKVLKSCTLDEIKEYEELIESYEKKIKENGEDDPYITEYSDSITEFKKRIVSLQNRLKTIEEYTK